MVFRSYFDDSGTQDGSKYCVMAGFIGEVQKWVSLSKQWSSTLEEFKIPSFHMTDFENGQRHFKGWTHQRKHLLLNRLLEIIRLNVSVGIASAVSLADYYQIIPTEMQSPNKVGSPLCIAWVGCLWLAGKWTKVNSPNAPLAYFLERRKGDGELAEGFNRQSESEKNEFRLGAISIDTKLNFIPLQAADIMAYEVYKYCLKERSLRYPFSKLLGIGCETRMFHRSVLAEIRDDPRYATLREPAGR